MSDLEQLRDKIRNMEPPDQLRLAAELLERGRFELARAVAERVVVEIGAMQTMGARKP